MEIISTDVLIIGSGGAGVRAALEAHNAGVRVTLVTKGRLGRHGATVTAAADIAVDSRSLHDITGQGNTDDSPEIFLEDMVVEGKWLNNQHLVKLIVEEVPHRVRELLQWGLKYTELRQMPGHRFPRGMYTSGVEVDRVLGKQVRQKKIQLIEDTYIHDLVIRDGEVIGAVGLELRRGKPVAFSAKAVIVATGGCHGAYSYSTGPEGLTGDGQAMAFRAGAELINMEMVQFIPTTPIEPVMARGSLFPFLLGPQNALRVWFLNKYGERFMSRWDSQRMEHSTRDTLSLGIMTEILEGRGGPKGGIYFSLAHLPKNLIADFARWGGKPFLKSNWYAHGLDCSPMVEKLMQGEAIEVLPAVHFFMGGVKVNERCETTIPGLYATGETAGGIHGANRLSGTAFSHILVLGQRAGYFAAQRVASQSVSTEPDKYELDVFEKRLLHPILCHGNVNPYEVKRELQDIAWHKLGVIRDNALLKTALKTLDEMKNTKLALMTSRAHQEHYNLEWLECLQVENIVLVQEAIARCALLRSESRGAHFRKDYPDIDNTHWLKSTIARMTGDGMVVTTEPVELPIIRPEMNGVSSNND